MDLCRIEHGALGSVSQVLQDCLKQTDLGAQDSSFLCLQIHIKKKLLKSTFEMSFSVGLLHYEAQTFTKHMDSGVRSLVGIQVLWANLYLFASLC